MFSITRKQKVKMNFIGSPQCGNAGDMKFTVEVKGTGFELDSQGFVFDSFHLFELFKELESGHWSGSCEGIGVFCAEWLFAKDPGVAVVGVNVTTESGNVLTITLAKGHDDGMFQSIKRVE